MAVRPRKMLRNAVLALSLMLVGYFVYCMLAGRSMVGTLFRSRRKLPVPRVRALDYACATDADHVGSADFLPDIKFLLFIVCHDARSEDIARRWSRCMPWTRVVRVPQTMFFESAAYPLLLARAAEWRSLDLVGVATYKSLKFLSLDQLRAALELARYRPYDAVPLYAAGEWLLRQAVAGHTQAFRGVWDGTLSALGFDEATIRGADRCEVFLRNTFVISPRWFERLGFFMNSSMAAVQRDPALGRLLAQDAHYREGKLPVARRVFGADYYHWHPFVFERLPVFFLHVSGAAVYSALEQVRLFENAREPTELLYKGL